MHALVLPCCYSMLLHTLDQGPAARLTRTHRSLSAEQTNVLLTGTVHSRARIGLSLHAFCGTPHASASSCEASQSVFFSALCTHAPALRFALDRTTWRERRSSRATTAASSPRRMRLRSESSNNQYSLLAQSVALQLNGTGQCRV